MSVLSRESDWLAASPPPLLSPSSWKRAGNGDKIDITAHALLASTLVRIAQCIGIDRPAKNTTPSLREYLAAKALR